MKNVFKKPNDIVPNVFVFHMVYLNYSDVLSIIDY